MIMLDFLHLDYIFLVLGFSLNFDFFLRNNAMLHVNHLYCLIV